MTIKSILNARERVLAIKCPLKTCLAAPGTLCMESYYNNAGVQTRHINIFHDERIYAAQTEAEKVFDQVTQVAKTIKENPIK